MESLKQYCGSYFKIDTEQKQWKKLSEICGYGLDDIKNIKDSASNIRHGGVDISDEKARTDFLTKTWDIVEKFISSDAFK